MGCKSMLPASKPLAEQGSHCTGELNIMRRWCIVIRAGRFMNHFAGWPTIKSGNTARVSTTGCVTMLMINVSDFTSQQYSLQYGSVKHLFFLYKKEVNPYRRKTCIYMQNVFHPSPLNTRCGLPVPALA